MGSRNCFLTQEELEQHVAGSGYSSGEFSRLDTLVPFSGGYTPGRYPDTIFLNDDVEVSWCEVWSKDGELVATPQWAGDPLTHFSPGSLANHTEEMTFLADDYGRRGRPMEEARDAVIARWKPGRTMVTPVTVSDVRHGTIADLEALEEAHDPTRRNR